MIRTIVLAVVLTGLGVGCTRAEPPTLDNTIVVRFDAEPDTLNPILYKTAAAQSAMFGGNNSQIYESLLQYNPKTWVLTEPLLAVSYPDISADRLQYTYRIRDGIQWHDGRPLTAEDVLFTFKAMMCSSVDSADKRSSLTDLTKLEIIADRSIRFTFAKANAFNIHSTGNQQAIIPRHVFDPDGLLDSFSFQDIIGVKGSSDPKIKEFGGRFNQHPNNRSPIGTGPYKFEKWETGREVHLVRHEEYAGRKPDLNRIIFRVVTDSAAALTALKAGEIDFDPALTPAQYAEQTRGTAFDAEFTKAKLSIPQYQYIGWSEERPFFKDRRVRQALTMLVNREQIIQTVRFGLGRVAATPFIPGSPFFNPNIKPLPYDPKRAAQLLDEAGWKDSDGDGVRDKEGVPFRIEFVGSAGSAFTVSLVAILKDEFRKAGIEFRERMVDFTVLVNCMLDHTCDAAANSWVVPLDTDPFQVFHSSSIANRGTNWISFRNAESDRLLEQARAEFDLEKRKQIYWRWQELMHDEQPYTLLMYPEVPAAYHNRFRNVEFIPNRPGYNLGDWSAR